MWAKLDDGLLDHAKLLEAGRACRLARRSQDGRIYALGLFSFFLLWANKHLTNGFMSLAVIEELNLISRPLDAVKIMVKAGFLDEVDGGYKIHDYHDHNPKAEEIEEKRRRDRERKQKGGKHRHAPKKKAS